jgi:hypothetical protein
MIILKKKFNYTKEFKKIAIKIIKIEIITKINFIVDWMVKLKGKINFAKGQKNQKNKDQN